MKHESSYPHRAATRPTKPTKEERESGCNVRRRRPLAPALEHGHQSNAKENDRADSNPFDPHMCASLQESVARRRGYTKGRCSLRSVTGSWYLCAQDLFTRLFRSRPGESWSVRRQGTLLSALLAPSLEESPCPRRPHSECRTLRRACRTAKPPCSP